MTTITRTERDFDHADLLNEDGTVTLRMAPSAWHAYNISPDTYQTVNGDSWVESTLGRFSEVGLPESFGPEFEFLDGHDIDFMYDHFEWDYKHSAIVRDFAGELANWMVAALTDAGLSCSIEVVDTWSPKEYNFTSDGFEVKVTCDPGELRALTADFDVDEWAAEYYRSRDGFMSFVTSRMNDDDWHAEYDGGFRIESLFAKSDDHDVIERGWVMALVEAEWDVYSDNVTITPNVDKIRELVGYEDSGFTLEELREWAATIMAEYQNGMEPLLDV